MSLLPFCEWLAATPWSIALHQSLYLYPLIQSSHVLGLMLFGGTIAMVDLRLLGFAFRDVPVPEMNARILPWTVAGAVIMVSTGLLLFYAIPVRTYQSIWFRFKLAFIAAAALNAWCFHKRVERNRDSWPALPQGARAAAATSLALWSGVIVFGRMIAYDWFDCERTQSNIVNLLAGCVAEAPVP